MASRRVQQPQEPARQCRASGVLPCSSPGGRPPAPRLARSRPSGAAVGVCDGSQPAIDRSVVAGSLVSALEWKSRKTAALPF